MFVSIFGNHISFFVEHQMVRLQVKNAIRLGKMKHAREFVFTTAEYELLDKYDGESEFCLDGNMYDVITCNKKSGQVVLLAFFDKKETTLLAKFTEMFSADTEKDDSSTHISQFRSLPEFYWKHGSYKLYMPVRYFLFHQPTVSFISYVTQPNSPPPDLG